jgi:hypothetical protein
MLSKTYKINSCRGVSCGEVWDGLVATGGEGVDSVGLGVEVLLPGPG